MDDSVIISVDVCSAAKSCFSSPPIVFSIKLRNAHGVVITIVFVVIKRLVWGFNQCFLDL